MSETADKLLYIFFFIFPIIMLIVGNKIKPNFDIFPVPIKTVDFVTLYLLLSVTIQSTLANLESAHLYFYIFLSAFGIIYATYLAFSKKILLIGKFFRTWWRYVFIFSFIYHLLIGSYGIYLNFFTWFYQYENSLLTC